MAAALSGQTLPDRVGSGLRRALERRLRDGWVASPPLSALLPGSASRSAMLYLLGPDEEVPYPSKTYDPEDALQR